MYVLCLIKTISTCLFSCRATAFNLSSVSMGNLCNTVPINGSLAVLIRSVAEDELPLILLDTNVFSVLELLLVELEFLLLSFIKSLGCCDCK